MGYEYNSTIDTIMEELGISDKYQGILGLDLSTIITEINKIKGLANKKHELPISETEIEAKEALSTDG